MGIKNVSAVDNCVPQTFNNETINIDSDKRTESVKTSLMRKKKIFAKNKSIFLKLSRQDRHLSKKSYIDFFISAFAGYIIKIGHYRLIILLLLNTCLI